MVGRVKWFNNRKGYGFIHFEEDKDVLVHYSSIIDKGYRSLIEGEVVEFDVVRTATGLRAKNVIPQKDYDIC